MSDTEYIDLPRLFAPFQCPENDANYVYKTAFIVKHGWRPDPQNITFFTSPVCCGNNSGGRIDHYQGAIDAVLKSLEVHVRPRLYFPLPAHDTEYKENYLREWSWKRHEDGRWSYAVPSLTDGIRLVLWTDDTEEALSVHKEFVMQEGDL